VIPWRKLAKIAGYFSAFVTLTLFFMVITFPMDKVAAHLESQIEAQTGRQVQIGAMELGFSGFEMEDLAIEMLPAGAEDEKSGMLLIDHLRVETSLLDLLSGDVPEARMEADLLGGTIRDFVIRPGESGELQVDLGEISDLAIHDIPGLATLTRIEQEIEGRLSLSGSLHWRGSLSASEGKVRLSLQDTVVRAPQVKIPEQAARQWGMDSIQLSDIRLGTLDLQLALVEKSSVRQLRAVPGARDARAIHLEEVQASGADVELVVDPQSAVVLGRAGMGASRLSVSAAVHLDEAFFTREVKKGDEIERPNLFLRTILQGSAQARAAEKNGYYGVQCRGLLSSPNCTLMKPTMRVGLKKPSLVTPKREEDPEAVGPEGPDLRRLAPRGSRKGAPSADEEPAEAEQDPRPSRGSTAAADRERRRKERDERIRKLKESRAARGLGASPTAVEAQDEESEDEAEGEDEEEPEEEPEEESDEEPDEESDEESDEEPDEEPDEEDPVQEEAAEESE
jgi:type II secretion system protein N